MITPEYQCKPIVEFPFGGPKMLSRRNLLRAIPALIAMPAIVRASSIMKIAPIRTRMSDEAIDRLVRPPLFLTPADMEFLEGMSQTIMATYYYGDPEAEPRRYSGFTPFYSLTPNVHST
jgi:hypothetical protein